jgi:RNA polymerase sigma-70 factor (ECF subfamily)
MAAAVHKQRRMMATISPGPSLAGNEPEDERLVALAQGGDEEAFERLALRYRDGIYRLALRIVSRPEDAEDVVQDVWLAVFQHLGRFRAESSFKTWLLRIAYNQSLQLRRFQGRAVLDRAEGGFDDNRTLAVAARQHTPEEFVLHQQERAWLGALLGGLPEAYRRALCLWAFESWSIERMAQELRISYGAAKTRIHRARAKFRRAAELSAADASEEPGQAAGPAASPAFSE